MNIESVETLIQFVLNENIALQPNQERFFSELANKQQTREWAILREFAKENYHTLIGNAYYQRYGKLEKALIVASQSGTKRLSQGQVEGLGRVHLKNVPLLKETVELILNTLMIEVDWSNQTPEEKAKEKSDKIQRATKLVAGYTSVDKLKRHLSDINDKMKTTYSSDDYYAFLNQFESDKCGALGAADQLDQYSPYPQFETRVKEIMNSGSSAKPNTLNKLAANAVNTIKNEEHRKKYHISLFRKKVKLTSSNRDALTFIKEWSLYASSEAEARELVTALFLVDLNQELDLEEPKEQRYFHCQCGRQIVEKEQTKCPICSNRSHPFENKLDELLAETYVALKMFQTAQKFSVGQPFATRIAAAKTAFFQPFEQAYEQRNYVSAQRWLSANHKQFPYGEWAEIKDKEKTLMTRIQQARMKLSALSRNKGNRQFLVKCLLESYKLCHDLPELNQSSHDYLGQDFASLYESNEVLSIDMTKITVNWKRQGNLSKFRLLADQVETLEIESITALELVFFESVNTSTIDELSPINSFYQHKDFRLLGRWLELRNMAKEQLSFCFRKKINGIYVYSEVKLVEWQSTEGMVLNYEFKKRFFDKTIKLVITSESENWQLPRLEIFKKGLGNKVLMVLEPQQVQGNQYQGDLKGINENPKQIGVKISDEKERRKFKLIEVL